MSSEPTASQVLTSLAILKVNWEKGHDYIQNFVPFAAEAMRTCPRREVSLPELQEAILGLFGFKLPLGPLQTILKRACKRGYVSQSGGVYTRNDAACEKLDLKRTRDRALREQRTLVDKLVTFCKVEHDLEWSAEKAETALFAYVTRHGASMIRRDASAIPIDTSAHEPEQHEEYAVASFIQYLEGKDAQGFDYLETVLKGNMLADVLFFPQIGNISGSFRHMEVYCDTSFLVRAMGYTTPSMKDACRELVDLLYSLNANLKCFDHTLAEIRGILNAAAGCLRSRHPYGHFESYEYFVRNGYGPSDVDLEIARLPQSLGALRVEVVPMPDHVKELTVDERALERALQDGVGYASHEALLRDLNSVTAIIRLRGGRPCYDLDGCRAILLTTNIHLTQALIDFFNQKASNTVPLCLPDDILATHAWLKHPQLAPDLPRNRLVADCYAAMQPSDELWCMYIEQVDRLLAKDDITANDYYLLRYSTAAQGALMDSTRGNSAAFADGTVEEVLEKAQSAIKSELLAELAANREALKQAERTANTAKQETQRRAQRLRSFAVRVARKTTIVIGCLIALLLAAGLLLTSSGLSDILAGRFTLRILLFLAQCVTLVLSLLNLVWGVTLRRLLRSTELRMAAWLERKLCHWFGSV